MIEVAIQIIDKGQFAFALLSGLFFGWLITHLFLINWDLRKAQAVCDALNNAKRTNPGVRDGQWYLIMTGANYSLSPSQYEIMIYSDQEFAVFDRFNHKIMKR